VECHVSRSVLLSGRQRRRSSSGQHSLQIIAAQTSQTRKQVVLEELFGIKDKEQQFGVRGIHVVGWVDPRLRCSDTEGLDCRFDSGSANYDCLLFPKVYLSPRNWTATTGIRAPVCGSISVSTWTELFRMPEISLINLAGLKIRLVGIDKIQVCNSLD